MTSEIEINIQPASHMTSYIEIDIQLASQMDSRREGKSDRDG